MGTLVTVTLGFAALLQLIAAVLALRAIRYSGAYRLAWIALSFALALMVGRRLKPLLEFRDGAADLADAYFALFVSALITFALVGMVGLLRSLRNHEEQLNRLATTDALTGLANRRQILDELDREVRRARRSRHPLSLLMVDVDRFKDVNDKHGHAAGDAVLVALGGRLRAILREIDSCGRIGGEEFVVLLPETDATGAAATAERLCADLAESPVETPGGPLAVTISIGVASYVPHPAQDVAPHDAGVTGPGQTLLQRADAALYRAKAGGRNCVRVDRAEAAAFA